MSSKAEKIKLARARYTREFKQEAVRLVQARQSQASVCRSLNLSAQTLYNWVKAHQQGRELSHASTQVSPEQMELSRLRSEVAQLKMERDILKKAAAYFAKESM